MCAYIHTRTHRVIYRNIYIYMYIYTNKGPTLQIGIYRLIASLLTEICLGQAFMLHDMGQGFDPTPWLR